MQPNFHFHIATMGCKANVSDSQTLEARLTAIGGIPQEENPDVYILNTCTVTDRADRDALAVIKKINAPLAIITGCMAEVDQALKEKLSNQNIIIAKNSAKEDISTTIADWLKGNHKTKMLQGNRVAWHTKVDFLPGAADHIQTTHRTRAFIKVQDGCNAFCSYCIIPKARGRSRSLNTSAIIDEVNRIAKQGTQEVVLTAIHAADYDDNGKTFTNLVSAVLENTKIPRLRLTSLDPAEIPTQLIDLMAVNPRLCAHFHMSIQSGNTRVLQAMHRHYDQQQAEHCLQEIFSKIPHCYVGMDIIAGFPSETAEEHNDTVTFLKRTPWTRLHVFPFSVRKGTEAARLVEQGLAVPEKIIHQRAKELRDLSDERMQREMQKKLGHVVEVLVEQNSQGHTRSYHKVRLSKQSPANTLVRVRLQSISRETFLASPF